MRTRRRLAVRSVTREWRMHLGKLVAAAFGIGAALATTTLLLAWLPPTAAGAAGMLMYMAVTAGLFDVADTYLKAGS